MPEGITERGTRMTWYQPDEYVYQETAAWAAQMIRAGGKVNVGGRGELQGLSFRLDLWSSAFII